MKKQDERRQSHPRSQEDVCRQVMLHKEWERLCMLIAGLWGDQATELSFDLGQWTDDEGQPHPFAHSVIAYDQKRDEVPFQLDAHLWDELCLSIKGGSLTLREVVRKTVDETEDVLSEAAQHAISEIVASWWSDVEGLPVLEEGGRYNCTKEPVL